MPSSKNQTTQASGATSSQQDIQQSYMLQEFLHAEPTLSERLSGVVQSGKGGKGNKGRDGKAKEAIKEFGNAWRNAGQ
ncbi:hypothetical protein F4779DRAFT_614708 [Xylariaceae sp. FL0662B]|nr:hypothetical protein F4779DRAFT_614708 [Xylariaceae sp. FL0662B]